MSLALLAHLAANRQSALDEQENENQAQTHYSRRCSRGLARIWIYTSIIFTELNLDK